MWQWLAWLDKLFCHVPLCQSVNKTVFLGLQLHKLKALFCFGHMIVSPSTPSIKSLPRFRFLFVDAFVNVVVDIVFDVDFDDVNGDI